MFGDGTCGSAVESLCDMSITACNSSRSIYNSVAQFWDKDDCIASSRAFPHNYNGTLASPVTSGHSIECRHYHALQSLKSIREANDHCSATAALGGINSTCGTPCEAYCSVMMASCSTSYSSYDICLRYCALYPVGDITSSSLLPTAGQIGNTLGCRWYWAQWADRCDETSANPVLGTCGVNCEAYCNVVQGACGNSSVVATSQYTNYDTCLLSCRTNIHRNGAHGALTGNSVQCRSTYAMIAFESNNKTIIAASCSAAGLSSSFCNSSMSNNHLMLSSWIIIMAILLSFTTVQLL
jgi:hypothetical protein